MTVGGQRKRLERVCAERGAPQLASATALPDAVGYLRRGPAGGPELVRVSRNGQVAAAKVDSLARDVAPTAGRLFFVGEVANAGYQIAVE